VRPAAVVLGKTVKKRAVSMAADPSGFAATRSLHGHERTSKYAVAPRPAAITGLARLRVAAER
jgi:hypothetical protein